MIYLGTVPYTVSPSHLQRGYRYMTALKHTSVDKPNRVLYDLGISRQREKRTDVIFGPQDAGPQPPTGLGIDGVATGQRISLPCGPACCQTRSADTASLLNAQSGDILALWSATLPAVSSIIQRSRTLRRIQVRSISSLLCTVIVGEAAAVRLPPG